MIRIELLPSAKLRAQVNDPNYTTTAEDMPPDAPIELPAVPRIGESIETEAACWQVVDAGWMVGADPIVTVE